MPYNTSLRFDSVVVIQSLRHGDLKTGTELFETILAPAAIAQDGFVAELHHARSRSEFIGHLRETIRMARQYGRSPILHLETHGSPEGLGLTNGDRISWRDLAPILVQLNQASRMNLLVMAAMCRGWEMHDILQPTDRSPVFAIIGTPEEPSAGKLLDAMKQFYEVAVATDRHDIKTALDSANETSDVNEWQFAWVGAEVLFCRIFAAYVADTLGDPDRAGRVNRLVADIARVRGMDVLQTMQLRAEIEGDMVDFAKWFDHYRRHFLHLDSFPENERRFPLRYEDCRETAA